MTSTPISAGDPFPARDLPVLGGGTRSLAKPRDGHDWMLTIVYRGKHCPLCTIYLRQLNEVLADLADLGVDLLAVSADDADRATAHMEEIKPRYDVAYGLSVAQMQALGLYISGPPNSPAAAGAFAEPGLFLINDQGLLQVVDIANVPFARPELKGFVQGLRNVRERTDIRPINGTFE